MNFYRNAYYYTQHSIKKDFHELVDDQVKGKTPIKDEFKLELDIYYKNPNCDGANISALIEKFALDGLQESGIIVDDNVKYHKGSTWNILEQDKDNPRCVVRVVPIHPQS
jgi:hypothetical protein